MKIYGYRFWLYWLKITLALFILAVVRLPFLPRKMLKSGAPLDYVGIDADSVKINGRSEG